VLPEPERLVLAEQRRIHAARRNRADADAVRRELERGALGHHVDGRLAHVVGEGELRRHPAVDRARVDDHSPLAERDEFAARGNDSVIDAFLVHGGDPVEMLCRIVLEERDRLADTGVVHHDVERTEPLHRRIDQCLHLVVARHVGHDAQHRSRVLSRQTLELRGAEVRGHHSGPFCNERADDGSADAAARAREHCNLAVESHGLHPVPENEFHSGSLDRTLRHGTGRDLILSE